MQLPVLWTILSVTGAALAEIIFTDYEAGSCTSGSAVGSYSYCCFDDNCYIPEYTDDNARCAWAWAIDEDCLDVPYEERPACTVNEYFTGGRYGSVPSELGTCVADDRRTCDLRKKNYSFQCCKCPQGYLSTRTRCDGNGDTRGRCMACSDPKEVLDVDYRTCTRPPIHGLTCDIVENLALQFEITSNEAPITNGYYRQILNLACLRSACEHPSCNAVRRYASNSPECKNLEGSFSFEQSVFSDFATPPNEIELRAHIVEIEEIEQTIEDWLLEPIESNPALNPVIRLAIYTARRFGPLDSKSIASAIAGYLHFQNDLAASFNAYINGVVYPSCNYDDYDLHSRLQELTLEHDRLFKCAVDVGFTAEVALNDLTPAAAAVAKVIVPIAATILRSADIAIAQLCIGSSNTVKRQADPIAKVEEYFEIVGAVLPVTPSLRHDIRNWDKIPYAEGLGLTATPGLVTVKKELNSTQGVSLTAELLSTCELNIANREDDLDPFVIEMTLFYPEQIAPSSPFLSQVSGKPIAVVGPIVSIRNPANEMAFLNATYVLGRNFYDPPILYKDAIAAVRGPRLPPSSDNKALMYRSAKLSLSYTPSFIQGQATVNPSSDIAIFDLLTGRPLPGGLFTDSSTGGGFKASLNLESGIYGGHWNGGGLFALGLLNASSTLTTSLTTSTTATSTTVSSTIFPPNSLSTSTSTTSITTLSTSSLASPSSTASSSRRPCHRSNKRS